MTIDQSLRRDLLKSTAPPKGSGEPRDPPTGLDLDQHLVSSSKQVLLKKIDFQPAERDVSFQLQNLRVKYVPLNPVKESAATKESVAKSDKKQSSTGMACKPSDGIPPPKRVLCSPDVVSLSWQKCHRIGAGLINMGNSCFLNSVLQCLTYTPPLVNFLLSHHHKDQCKELGFCMMCALQTHIQRAFQHNQPAIRPMVILNKLKHIAKHMHQGRQEDAHEFLRYLIEAMQKSCINGFEKLDRLSKETSIVHQIFGGYYRSRVTCAVCQAKSDTYDPILDIGLDIKHAPTVNKAFEKLIRPETLDGENMYQCKKCNRKVQAQKRFTIHRPPKILTLCLKRFDFNRFSMGKIHKDVAYTEYLNLRPYMSETKGASVVYKLYAVLKHEGASCNSGHYYCYVKAPNESWYCMNDAYISQVGVNRVLNQNAYLLFYTQKEVKPSVNGSVMRPADSKTSVKQHPATTTKPANPYNGPLGTSVSRQQFIGPVKPKMIAEPPIKKKVETPTAKHTNLPAAVPLPDQRTKLQFTIRRPGVPPVNTGSKLVKPSVSNTPASASKSADDQKSVNKSATVPSPSSVTKPDASTNSNTPSVKTAGKTIVTPAQSLATPGKSMTASKAKLQALVKPKPTPAKTGFMGLVPYTAEDSNSSSDSENYDALAEQLSKTPADTKSISKGDVDKNGSTIAKGADKDRTIASNAASSDMKPPSQTISHTDILNGTPKKQRSLANGTDLTVLRKPDSPLKLTITTNGNAQRLKATGHWRVSDMESQVSPSPASDSSLHSNHSNVSTNSTSEWTVREKMEAPSTPQKVKEEAAVYGWNITPGKLELMRSFSDPGGIAKSALAGTKSMKQAAKQAKEAEDMERTTNWLVNKHSSDKVETEPLFGFTAKPTKVIIDSNIPRNLTGAFESREVDEGVEMEARKSKEPSRSSSPSHSVKSQGNDVKDTEKEIAHKKKKHKKNKRDIELEVDAEEMYEEKSMRTVSDKAKSPDAEEGDSGYYSIKSKNLGSDLEEDENEEEEEMEETDRKPKKHKKKKRKHPSDDEDGDATQQEEYGPALPDTIKNRNAADDKETSRSNRVKSPDTQHKHRSQDNHKHLSDYKHKSNKAEQRLKSLEHNQPRHKLDDTHRFRSPDRDGHNSNHKTFSHGGHSHKNRHRSTDRDRSSDRDRHRVRSPDYDRRMKSPNYDHRVRSPDYEHQRKKHRSGDSENTKHRTHGGVDRHRYSSDESDRYHSSSKFSVNRTSDDEDHSYAKRVKEKKRKRKQRDRDEYSDRGDDYESGSRDNTHKNDHRKNRDDVLERLESPTFKKRKSGGDQWGDDSSTTSSKGYGDERRKSEGKSRHDAPTQQWDHHIKDGYKRSHNDDGALNRLSAWDGKRSATSNVIEELSQSSMKAYGPAIPSWDGGKSAIDDELERDIRSERKQRDAYDEEFDRGKVKKVKHRYESDKHGSHHNPFQAEQTRRNFYPHDHYDRHRPYPKKSYSWHSGGQKR